MKKQGIYYIEHIASGKKYIGSSMNVNRRFTRHRSALNNNKHHCVYLQRAVNKYGLSAFKFYLVEETEFTTINELHSLEEIYIQTGEDLYNVGSVGGGDNLTNNPNRVDIILRTSNTMRSNIGMMTVEERQEKWGKPGVLNGRWKDGRSMKVMCPVCNTNEKSSGAKTCKECVTYDRKGEKNSFYGKSHSEETLKILRAKPSPNKGLKPEEIPYTKQYEITYPDGNTKTVYGLKAIATEFDTSIANVALTVERMVKNSIPTKRSKFFQHNIKVITQ